MDKKKYVFELLIEFEDESQQESLDQGHAEVIQYVLDTFLKKCACSVKYVGEGQA